MFNRQDNNTLQNFPVCDDQYRIKCASDRTNLSIKNPTRLQVNNTNEN